MSATATAGQLLREARVAAGLTQRQLAERAGVTQSVVSAYESGTRQPSLETLRRLVAATGLALDVHVRHQAEATTLLTGPLGQRVLANRDQVKSVARRYGAENVRVLGSVARGDETLESDIDLLVDLDPKTGLLGLGRLMHDLSVLLDAAVDIAPADTLKPDVARAALTEAVAL